MAQPELEIVIVDDGAPFRIWSHGYPFRTVRWHFHPDLVVVLAGIGVFLSGYRRAGRRRAAQLSAQATRFILARAVAVTLVLGAAAFYLERTRGVPWMLCFFLVLVVLLNYALTRTQWGRQMRAVGGNREAARRAGINVRRVYVSAFML